MVTTIFRFWLRLFRKWFVRAKFDIYIFIISAKFIQMKLRPQHTTSSEQLQYSIGKLFEIESKSILLTHTLIIHYHSLRRKTVVYFFIECYLEICWPSFAKVLSLYQSYHTEGILLNRYLCILIFPMFPIYVNDGR